MKNKDKTYMFVIAHVLFWGGIIGLLFITQNPIIFVILGPIWLYLTAVIALLFSIFGCEELKTVSTKKKLCFCFFPFMFYSVKFQYWLFKDTEPPI